MSSSHDTTRKFLHSSGAALLSQGWRVLVTLGVMILCRHLVPAEEYGLWNWVMPAFLVLGAVRDLGLAYHVLRVEPRPYGNLLRLELVWGAVVTAAVLLGAPRLVEATLESPSTLAVAVTRAMAVFLLLEGLSTVPKVYFEGELRVGRTFLPEIARNLLMATTTITLVLLGHGVWSMVIGQIAGAALYTVWLWVRAWGQIPLTYHPDGTWPLVRTSMPLASIWLLTIAARSIDPFILGARFAPEVIAIYGIALKNAFRQSEILIPALGRSLFPALVAFKDDRRKLFETYALTTLVMMSLEVPAALVLFVNAELVVSLLGGAQYVAEAPTYLRILCFAPLVDPFTRLGGEVLKTRHHDRTWIVAAFTTLASFTTLGIVLTSRHGAIGMAYAKMVPLGVLVMAWALHRIAPAGFRHLLPRLLFVYLVPVPLFAAVAWAFGTDQPWLRLGASLLAAVLSVAICGRRFAPEMMRYIRDARSHPVDAVPAGPLPEARP